MTQDSRDELKVKALTCRDKLYKIPSDDDLTTSKALIKQLKDAREYELMGELAEAISRHEPNDANIRRLYAQQLIEAGKATVAIDVLNDLKRQLKKKDPEYAEVGGLLGRAYKQIYFDAGDKSSTEAISALKKSIKHYRKVYGQKPEKNTWHGVNLVALLTHAQGVGLDIAVDLSPKKLAKDLSDCLLNIPEQQRDEWHLQTLAELSVAGNDLDTVESRIKECVGNSKITAFQLNSLLRQLTEVWRLDQRDERSRGVVSILRARIAQMDGGNLDLKADAIQALRKAPDPEHSQLEAILGKDGHKTYRWWKTGLERARAVAAVYQKLGSRIGTGFLVKAGDLSAQPAEQLLLLTNYHVVNPEGLSPGLRPEDAEVAFETESRDERYAITEVVWSSPIEQHDACLVRLESVPESIEPLPLARNLPALQDTAKVYVIGHPRGKELSFSFQDNDLLDHEGPPNGVPVNPMVCRVHYRAPTEPGSSGSPVFNTNLWQVIALHHAGGKYGMSRLNGKEGTYSANEGISIQSIISAIP